uniref:Uncharacterized protein n=1 Tax=Phlebotomus papatasi TaxID=29031 RepID=A0A1B0GPU1_PHLPP
MVVYQQYRTVRFGLVLGIVVLTVFLYISYYTNPIEPLYTKQQHHLAPSAVESLPLNAAALVSGGAYDNFTSNAGNRSAEKFSVISTRNETKVDERPPPSGDDAIESSAGRQSGVDQVIPVVVHQPSSSSSYYAPPVATGSQNSFKESENEVRIPSAGSLQGSVVRLTAQGASAVENTPPKTSASSANE